MALKYKENEQERLEREFHEELDPRLRAMILEIERFMWREFGKDTIITHICRTQKEQDSFYQDKIEAGQFRIGNDGIKHYNRASVHQVKPSRGTDIRSWIYDDDEIRALDEYIEKWFPYGKGRDSLIHHNIGLGSHIHLQVPWMEIT